MPKRQLITEREIRRALQEGVNTIDVSGAAVTPSAIDLAHRLRVTLQGLRGEERRVRATGKPTTANAERGADIARAIAVPTAPRTAPARSSSPATAMPLRVAAAADHGGVALKDAIVSHLREKGHSVVDHGTSNSEPVDYPDFALKVARAVASNAAEFGIMVDGAGIGSCMAANKVAGVRAAMCYDVTTAINAREHNNANVLTLGGGLLGSRLAVAIVETFLTTPFAGGRHAGRVAKIDALLP